jgi:hypothetical protein
MLEIIWKKLVCTVELTHPPGSVKKKLTPPAVVRHGLATSVPLPCIPSREHIFKIQTGQPAADGLLIFETAAGEDARIKFSTHGEDKCKATNQRYLPTLNK